MMQFEKNGGWRTRGVKQLTVKEILIACNQTERLTKDGVTHSITIICTHDYELERAMGAWAGFKREGNSLKYKGLEIKKN